MTKNPTKNTDRLLNELAWLDQVASFLHEVFLRRDINLPKDAETDLCRWCSDHEQSQGKGILVQLRTLREASDTLTNIQFPPMEHNFNLRDRLDDLRADDLRRTLERLTSYDDSE